MDNKKKTLIISSIIILLLVLVVGGAYAFFTYENGTKSDIVTGQIYMNYEETSTISLTGVFPETKEQALARQDENGVFEFTITGRNTSKYPVYYEIDLLEGGVMTGKTETSTKILPEHVRIYLERDGEPLVDGMTFKDFNNRRIYVETVPANQTTNIEHKYTLRMWIDENVTISDTALNADYTTSEWNDSYTSLKVRVVGDLNPKELPGPMIRVGSAADYKFWSDDIENVKSSIKEVNFIQLENSEIDTRFNAATIKSDVSPNNDYPVKVWLETNETDSSKYTMYVASEEEIYFPSDCSSMFDSFTGVEEINFDNADTGQVTDMNYMFYDCNNLIQVDVSDFDTSQVMSMRSMFARCRKLVELDTSDFNTSNVTTMYQMFGLCNSLIELDLSKWDTSNVTTMQYMFCECHSLKSLDLSNWNINKVTAMSYMFTACYNLLSLDISNFSFDKVLPPYEGIFNSVGRDLPTGTYTTVYVKDDYELDGTTYSPQNWILNITGPGRPSEWSTSNVIVKQ